MLELGTIPTGGVIVVPVVAGVVVALVGGGSEGGIDIGTVEDEVEVAVVEETEDVCGCSCCV